MGKLIFNFVFYETFYLWLIDGDYATIKIQVPGPTFLVEVNVVAESVRKKKERENETKNGSHV